MNKIFLIAHNLRSAHNVGSLLRTADAMAVDTVYLTGYTPYPKAKNDTRLPHLSTKIDKNIAKTALGAEKSINWEHSEDISSVINNLKHQKVRIIALEQNSKATSLPDFVVENSVAIVVGREVEGIENEVLAMSDSIAEIPMLGDKESLNVAQAAAMALYHCRFSK